MNTETQFTTQKHKHYQSNNKILDVSIGSFNSEESVTDVVVSGHKLYSKYYFYLSR